MPAANQRISEYVLEERIGGGTFGEVWRARHHVWADQLVAIKIPTDPSYIRNLQREGQAVHGLSHPNIVAARGFDPYADPPYLVMEYVPGTSLRPLIENRTLSIDHAVAVMKQVLAGVAYAHGQGVMHRDIKPENILVHERAAKEGYASPASVKVTDFGLGRAATSSIGAGSIAYSQSIGGNDAKRIAGTLDYMAPEQRGGGDVDHRADLYACGVVMFELLTGEKPAGTDLPSDINSKVPKALDDVFRRAYARLEKRFGGAEDFANALEAAMAEPVIQSPPPVPHREHRADVVASISGSGKQCPSCRRPTGASDQFCMHCGVQLVEWVLRCPQCGAYPDPTDRFCIFCGVAVSPQGAA